MTGSLLLYSGTFMRYAMAVTPKNYLLFACHFVNFNAQLVQGYRWQKHWYGGGREQSLKEGVNAAIGDVKEGVLKVEKKIEDEVRHVIGK